MSVCVRVQVYSIFLEEIVRLHKGQGTEICWHEKKSAPSLPEYYQMISNKTTSLFRLIHRLMEVFASKQDNKLAHIIEQFGNYYQIRDDYINVADPDYWKKKGFFEDLDEGKYSYIMLKLQFKMADTFPEDVLFKDSSTQDKIDMYRLLESNNVLNEVYLDLQIQFQELKQSLSELGNENTILAFMQILNKLDIKKPLSTEEVKRIINVVN